MGVCVCVAGQLGQLFWPSRNGLRSEKRSLDRGPLLHIWRTNTRANHSKDWQAVGETGAGAVDEVRHRKVPSCQPVATARPFILLNHGQIESLEF